MTPKKNIHKTFIPKKYLFFWKPEKILKFKILNPKKWPEPRYVWKYQSTPPPPPGLEYAYFLSFICFQWITYVQIVN